VSVAGCWAGAPRPDADGGADGLFAGVHVPARAQGVAPGAARRSRLHRDAGAAVQGAPPRGRRTRQQAGPRLPRQACRGLRQVRAAGLHRAL